MPTKMKEDQVITVSCVEMKKQKAAISPYAPSGSAVKKSLNKEKKKRKALGICTGPSRASRRT